MATDGPGYDITEWIKDSKIDLKLDLQPFQVKLVESMVQLKEGFRTFSVSISGATKAAKLFASTVRWVYWKNQHRHFQTYGLVRPNGKPRRSGRRHKGMPAWRGKYA